MLMDIVENFNSEAKLLSEDSALSAVNQLRTRVNNKVQVYKQVMEHIELEKEIAIYRGPYWASFYPHSPATAVEIIKQLELILKLIISENETRMIKIARKEPGFLQRALNQKVKENLQIKWWALNQGENNVNMSTIVKAFEQHLKPTDVGRDVTDVKRHIAAFMAPELVFGIDYDMGMFHYDDILTHGLEAIPDDLFHGRNGIYPQCMIASCINKDGNDLPCIPK